MVQRIRLWEVTEKGELSPIESGQISLENKLENWLENNISVLDENLLVIGRQVKTDYNKFIDLLCIDRRGDLVVVELKKGQTAREVTTQALDYASWVKDLDSKRINSIFNGEGTSSAGNQSEEDKLEDAFRKQFEEDLPETLNLNHRSLVVAESIDAATERIVRYLSELGVPINVATVQYFKDKAKDGEERELLARVFLVDPEVAQAKAQASSKRRKGYITINQLLDMADKCGVGELCRQLRDSISKIDNIGHEASYSRPNTLRFYHKDHDGKTLTVMFVDFSSPEKSAQKELRFLIHATRFNDLLSVSKEKMENLLPSSRQEANEEVRKLRNSTAEEKAGAVGFKGAFSTKEEVDKFTKGLKKSQAKEG